MSPDVINGLFELLGGLLCWLNVKQILKEKRVAGINIWVQAFFSAWGFWNLYYYPTLGQWYSFGGGIFLALGNTVWVWLAYKYTRRQCKWQSLGVI